MTASSSSVTERLLRDLTPQVLGAIVRRYGDFSAAEDAVQDALVAASLQWPQQGLPDNPRAWLIHVARRRMTDHLRTELARRRRETEGMQATLDDDTVAPAEPDEASAIDDTLRLLFMCCHPTLTRPTAIALTLRAVGGLTTAEIARAFLVPEATMAQRISRAKQTIKSSGVPFEMPSESERSARLSTVLHVLYLVFNEGYATSSGPSLARVDLSSEAIRLTRAVHALAPDHAETAGLLALMILTDARRPARMDAHGELVPLDEQDRTRWDPDAIREGVALISRTLPRGEVGPYQLQAAIAAVHDEAARAEDTDWPQVLALYDVLYGINSNPIVALNRAIAVAMVNGARAGLALLDALESDSRLREQHRLEAARAHLLERAGDRDAAVIHYRAAATRTTNVPERNYLLMRAARLAKASKMACPLEDSDEA